MATLPGNSSTAAAAVAADPMDAAMAMPGYRICIDVSADGQISVATEDLPEAIAPMDGMPDDMATESASQPVADIKEALTLALEMYRSQEDATGADTGNNAFDAGFAGTTPTTRGARA